MVRALVYIVLGGFLALSAAQAQDAGKPVRRVSLLYQIGTDQITKAWLQSLQRDARRALREGNIGHRGVVIEGNQVQVKLADPGMMDVVLPRLKQLALPLPGTLFSRSPGFDAAIADSGNGVIIIEPTVPGLQRRIETALSRTAEIVRHRADPDGKGEATVELQEPDRILIQVPETAAAEVKARLGVTAKLTFQLVDISISVEEAQAQGVPPDDLLLPDTEHPGRPMLVHKEVILSGDDLILVEGSLKWHDMASVNFEFNGRGTAALARVSQENIGKPFAIVLDDKVISAPLIRSEIPGGRGEITGGFDLKEANRLALLLRSGALPAPLSLIEERTAEP